MESEELRTKIAKEQEEAARKRKENQWAEFIRRDEDIPLMSPEIIAAKIKESYGAPKVVYMDSTPMQDVPIPITSDKHFKYNHFFFCFLVFGKILFEMSFSICKYFKKICYTYFQYSFNTHSSGTVSTHTFQVQISTQTFQVKLNTLKKKS